MVGKKVRQRIANAPLPFLAPKSVPSYLDFLGLFLSLVAFRFFWFRPIQPQPQLPFLSAILITPFLSIEVHGFLKMVPNILIKYFSNHLNLGLKNFI
jgi:hypothetical protein